MAARLSRRRLAGHAIARGGHGLGRRDRALLPVLGDGPGRQHKGQDMLKMKNTMRAEWESG